MFLSLENWIRTLPIFHVDINIGLFFSSNLILVCDPFISRTQAFAISLISTHIPEYWYLQFICSFWKPHRSHITIRNLYFLKFGKISKTLACHCDLPVLFEIATSIVNVYRNNPPLFFLLHDMMVLKANFISYNRN